MEFKVNFNEYVKVKITPYGEEILKKHHDSLGIEGFEFELKKDAEGYSRFQLWSLMKQLGTHLGRGKEEPFESEIIFSNKTERGWI